MAAEIICDGCGRRAPMIVGATGNWYKPGNWYERTQFQEDAGGRLGRPVRNWTACSRECIEKLAKEDKSHGLVLPV